MAIDIKVKAGKVEIETLDIKGSACKSVIDRVVEATKVAVTSERPTDDFHASTEVVIDIEEEN